MIDAISTYVNGSELDRVSVLDLDAYEDTDLNWRARRGYGALVAAYGADCPLALNAQVTLIDHSGTRLRIETSRGTLTAGKVIVTVPTNLIADESIRFHPKLPAKVDAARGLPLGLADKVTLALAEPEALPKEGNLRGASMRTEMGTYHLRPFGQPCIEGFFGGRFARALEDAGDGAIAAAAIDEITSFLGNDFRAKLKPLAESRWALDPFARGSYSHALPGHAGDRAVLAAPVDGRLFFAGEATSPHFFSTAHGARDSGERAAREVLAGGKPATGLDGRYQFIHFFEMADGNRNEDWTAEELDLIIADYFSMLSAEIRRVSYDKTQHRKTLMAQIDRSNGSIEFKHHNISAVLQQLDLPWINGYKPRAHFQKSIVNAIERYLLKHPAAQHPEALAQVFAERPQLFVEPPPQLEAQEGSPGNCPASRSEIQPRRARLSKSPTRLQRRGNGLQV